LRPDLANFRQAFAYLYPMNREFIVNIAFLVTINLLIKPIYLFGIDRTVQNTVEAGAYGLYFALFNFTYLFQIINDLGIQYFNNRNIAQHRHLLDKYFPHLLVLKGLLALLYFGTIILMAWWWGYTVHLFPLLLLMGVNQMLSSLLLFLRSNISGLGLYRIDSFLSVLDRLLLIFLCGALLVIPYFSRRFQIEWFIIAQTTTLLLTCLTAYGVLRKQRVAAWSFRWRTPLLLLILRESAPYALVIFLMTLYTRIDGVMVERLHPEGLLEADKYAAAYRLLDASNMLGLLFAGLLFPMFARTIRDRRQLNALLGLGFRTLWTGAVALAMASIAFREIIMVTLYTNGSAYSGHILGWLMLTFLATSGSYVFGTLLGAAGVLRPLNGLALAGVVLNVALNWRLIPNYGALGAAWSTCATQWLVFLGQALIAQRVLSLHASARAVGRLLAYTLAAALLSLGFSQLEAGPWFMRYLAAIALSLLGGFFFRLMDWEQLRQLLPRAAKE